MRKEVPATMTIEVDVDMNERSAGARYSRFLSSFMPSSDHLHGRIGGHVNAYIMHALPLRGRGAAWQSKGYPITVILYQGVR